MWKLGGGISTNCIHALRPCARRNTASRFSASPVPASRRRLAAAEMSSNKLRCPATARFFPRNSVCRIVARCHWIVILRRCALAALELFWPRCCCSLGKKNARQRKTLPRIEFRKNGFNSTACPSRQCRCASSRPASSRCGIRHRPERSGTTVPPAREFWRRPPHSR